MYVSRKYGELGVASVNVFFGSDKICFRNFTAVYLMSLKLLKRHKIDHDRARVY